MFILKRLRVVHQSICTIDKFISVNKYCSSIVVTDTKLKTDFNIEEIDWKKELQKIKLEENANLLEPVTDLRKFQESEITPYTKPSFNLAAYVNKSETLQQLIKLGVDLNLIEKRKGVGQYILKLDFDNDIRNHLIFLNDIGVNSSLFGEIITKNPLIFKESIENFQIRMNYLESKNFTTNQIIRIIEKNPFWLMFTTKRIDSRLGFFQKTFKLNGDELRLVAVKQPKLITYQMEHIRKNTFSIKEEMGFDEDETKCLLLKKPRLWMMNQNDMLDRFEYLHKNMNLSHLQLVEMPEILTSRLFRIRQRHEFLEKLGRAQYDPKKDLYVSPKCLVEGSDSEFVINICQSSLTDYDNFLKTL